MDMRQAFPGQHIKASDLGGGTATLTIKAVAMAKVGDDEKPVVAFYETPQDLVLNKTNCNTVIEAYGPESQGWIGRQITLFPTRVQFGAEMVDAIRVSMPQQGAPQPGYGQQPGYPPAQPQQPFTPPPATAQGVVAPYQQGQPQPQYAPQPGAPAPQQGVPAPGGFGAPAPAPAPYPGVPGGHNPLG